MTTWTNMKIGGLVKFSLSSLKTHVTAESLYGSQTLSVKELRRKVADRDVHPVVKKIYRDMLAYYEKMK